MRLTDDPSSTCEGSVTRRVRIRAAFAWDVVTLLVSAPAFLLDAFYAIGLVFTALVLATSATLRHAHTGFRGGSVNLSRH